MGSIKKVSDFGSVVKSARQAKKITQSVLAERLCISTRYLKAIENSGRKPSFGLLERIICELDISMDAILCQKDEEAETATKQFQC